MNATLDPHSDGAVSRRSFPTYMQNRHINIPPRRLCTHVSLLQRHCVPSILYL